MTKPAPETKDTVKKMTLGGVGKSLLGGVKKSVIKTVDFLHKKFGSTEHIDEGKKLSNTEYLGEIYKMMKTIDADKRLHQEMAKNLIISEEHKKDIRNKEIINALAGRKNKSKFKPKLKTPPPPPDKTKPDTKKDKKDKTPPKNPKQSKKATTNPKTTTPTPKTIPKSSGGGAKGVVKTIVGVAVGLTGYDAAFAKTAAMEAGTTNTKEALAKVYQSIKDTNNTSSFGLIGLNTGRGKEGKGTSSLDSFISDFNRDYPNQKITEDPGTSGENPKFLEQWKKIDPQTLYDAQKKWYKNHVYNPTVVELEKSGVASDVASDERVQTYMADRVNQNGLADFHKSIKESGALKAKTAEEFMDKMTNYDKANVKKKFKGNIEDFGPGRIESISRRFVQRQQHSLGQTTESAKAEDKKTAEPVREPIKTDTSAAAQPVIAAKPVSSGKFTPLSEKDDLSYDKLTDAQKDAVEVAFRSQGLRFSMYNEDSKQSWDKQVAKARKNGNIGPILKVINEAGSSPVKVSQSLDENEALEKPSDTVKATVISKSTILPHTNERTNSGVDNINIGELMSNKEKEDRQRKKWEETLKLANDPTSQPKVKEEPELPLTDEQEEAKRKKLKREEEKQKLEELEKKRIEFEDAEKEIKKQQYKIAEAKSAAFWIQLQQQQQELEKESKQHEIDSENWFADHPLMPGFAEPIFKNSNQTRSMIRAMFD